MVAWAVELAVFCHQSHLSAVLSKQQKPGTSAEVKHKREAWKGAGVARSDVVFPVYRGGNRVGRSDTRSIGKDGGSWSRPTWRQLLMVAVLTPHWDTRTSCQRARSLSATGSRRLGQADPFATCLAPTAARSTACASLGLRLVAEFTEKDGTCVPRRRLQSETPAPRPDMVVTDEVIGTPVASCG